MSLDRRFCMSALERAYAGQRPEIFNYGSRVAVHECQNSPARLFKEGIQISMDGRGRALDNIFVERLWRSVKYEEVVRHEVA